MILFVDKFVVIGELLNVDTGCVKFKFLLFEYGNSIFAISCSSLLSKNDKAQD